MSTTLPQTSPSPSSAAPAKTSIAPFLPVAASFLSGLVLGPLSLLLVICVFAKDKQDPMRSRMLFAATCGIVAQILVAAVVFAVFRITARRQS